MTVIKEIKKIQQAVKNSVSSTGEKQWNNKKTSCQHKTWAKQKENLHRKKKTKPKHSHIHHKRTLGKTEGCIFSIFFLMIAFAWIKDPPMQQSPFSPNEEGVQHRAKGHLTNSCKQKFFQPIVLFQKRTFHDLRSPIPKEPGRINRHFTFLHKKFK